LSDALLVHLGVAVTSGNNDHLEGQRKNQETPEKNTGSLEGKNETLENQDN